MPAIEGGELAAAWVAAYTLVLKADVARTRGLLNAQVYALHTQPEQLWAFIRTVLAQSPSAAVLTALAYGPLETLLARHGPAFIDRVEQLAGQDARFRDCLGAVWLEARDTPVWQRVYAAAGREPPATAKPTASPEWAYPQDDRQ